ncbi:unnamed protein product, partial [Amoebophrya sp. A120]|eukprot:GSA120T00022248001.1
MSKRPAVAESSSSDDAYTSDSAVEGAGAGRRRRPMGLRKRRSVKPINRGSRVSFGGY